MSTFVEQDCVVEHEGKTFEAGGAYVVGDRALVYIVQQGPHHVSRDWHGNALGIVLEHVIGARRWTAHGRYRMAYVRVMMPGEREFWGRYNYDGGQAVRLKEKVSK